MTDVTLQSTLVDNTLVQERVLALLSGFFSTVPIVSVGVGLYGVLGYSGPERSASAWLSGGPVASGGFGRRGWPRDSARS